MSNDTIIVHQYTNICKTVQLPPGLADFLRGCMFFYRYSKNVNYKLYVDFKKHPIGNFITSNDGFEINDEQPVEYFNISHDNFQHIFNNNKTNYVITNHVIDYPLNDDEKDYMKKILNFKPELLNEVATIKSHLNLNNYCVIHIRSGDIDCNNDLTIPWAIEQNINNIISEFGNDNILVISDSYMLKNKLANKYNLKITSCVPIHLGIVSDYFNYTDPNYKDIAKISDNSFVKDTLVEFLLMTTAKKIYCFSIYHNSGFSRVISEIYDVPRIQIQI